MELLFELFLDASPVYLYLSAFVSIMCAYQILHIHLKKWRIHNDVHVRNNLSKNITNHVLLYIYTITVNLRHWLAEKFARLSSTDDEADSSFSFTHTQNKQLRGGERCNQLYSLSLKNINY